MEDRQESNGLKIAINALSAKTGGGVVYLNNLIESLRKIDNRNNYYIFVTILNRRKIINFENERFKVEELHIYNLLHRLFYEQIIMPFVLWRLKIGILYSPAEIATFLSPCEVVLGIQNLNVYYKIPIERSLTEKVRLWFLRWLAKFSSWKASKMIFVSNTACKDIIKKLKINPAKTKAIYHGVEFDRFHKVKHKGTVASIRQATASEEYILCLSTLSRHKNIETLIRAYAALDKRVQSQYKLVIAGRKIFPYYGRLADLTQRLDINGNVTFTGEVPFEKVPALYHESAVFVLPSYLETFGIPLIEAMASGVPVIASNASAIPEVVGDAGLLFDPNDPDDLQAKMEQVLTDLKLRNELIERGLKRAKLFSWEKCAKETLAVFKEVYETNKGKL